MKRSIAVLLLISAILFTAACTETIQTDYTGPDEDLENVFSPPEEANDAYIDTENEPQENSTDEAEPLINYLGKTVEEVLASFGDEYTTSSGGGGEFIFYDNFCFGYPWDGNTITELYVYGDTTAIDKFKGAMTYEEIIDAIDLNTDVPMPTRYLDESEGGGWQYSVSFEYRGYMISYTWPDEDPRTTKSYSALITMPD